MGKVNSRSTFAMLVRHAPAGARAYFLQGGNRRFPDMGGWSLEPFQPPASWVPAGPYQVCYLSHVRSETVLPGKNPRAPFPLLNLEPASSSAMGAPSSRVPVHLGSTTPAAVADTSLGNLAPQAPAIAAAQPTARSSDSDDPLLHNPEHLQNRVDFMGQQMKQELARNRQLAGKELMFLRELGEVFVLNGAYRQEATQAIQMTGQSAREYGDLSRLMVGTTLEQLDRLKVAFKEYTTPTKPIDYVTAFAALLKEASPLVREVISMFKPPPNNTSARAEHVASPSPTSKLAASPADTTTARSEHQPTQPSSAESLTQPQSSSTSHVTPNRSRQRANKGRKPKGASSKRSR